LNTTALPSGTSSRSAAAGGCRSTARCPHAAEPRILFRTATGGSAMPRLPTLFVSHGAPTFALEPGLAGARLRALGEALPRPEAVLVVSPHWMTPMLRVATGERPQTIHDFGGFDPALHEMTYPAAGHPALARRAIEIAPHAQRAHPTPEHFLPLLVAAGAAANPLPAAVVEGGIVHGVLSMDGFMFGEVGDRAVVPH